MTIAAEDVPKEIVAATALALWIVMMRTEFGRMPDDTGLRMLAANVLNAAEWKPPTGNSDATK